MASLTRFHRCISRSNSISRFYASKSDGQRFDEIANPQMQQFTSPNDASESDGQQYENVENLLRQRQFAPLNDTRGLNRDMNMVKLVGSIHAIENSFTSSDAGSRPMVRITLEMRTGYLHRSGDGSLRVERNFVPIRVFDHQLVPKCSRLQAGRDRNPHGGRRFEEYEGTTSLLSSSQSVRPQTAGSSNIGPSKVQWRSYQTEDFTKKTQQVEEQIYTLQNRREDDILFSHTRNRKTSLLFYDLIQLVVEYLMYFALLLSSSLRWTWPVDWIKGMGWTFLFNLDIYEFAKIYTPNVYVSVQAGYTASSSVPVPFWSQMLVWGIVTIILATTFLGIFLYLWRKSSPRYYIQMACLRRYFLLITQFLAIPFGATLGKVFHCTATNNLDVDNTLVCFGGVHWAYLAVAIIAALAFYFLIPAYMIYRTDRQIVSLTSEKHDAYLRLKEHEYKRGLDALWYISEFFIFSSYHRSGIFFRPVMHLMKLVIVGVYAGLFNSMQIQGILFCVIFYLTTVAFAIVRPYRVNIHNIYLIICYGCLGSLALMGALRSSFTSFTVSSPFLLPSYTTGILGLITGAWFIATIVIIVLTIRQRRRLWPKLEIDQLESAMNTTENQGVTTRKYIKAVLRAKAVIEYALSMPPMFAPVHELSRQVLLVNALFREAEAFKDPIQDTLWDILEELSQLHARLLPRSLFAESVKPSVRRTAAEFLALMPQLARRLHQREYDFIMVHPIRRRILFKLYVMSVFIRGSQDVREREKRVCERVERVWRSNDDQNDIYYPSLYPEAEEGPSVLSVSMPIARELRKDDDRRELELKAISNSLVDLTEAGKDDIFIEETDKLDEGFTNDGFDNSGEDGADLNVNNEIDNNGNNESLTDKSAEPPLDSVSKRASKVSQPSRRVSESPPDAPADGSRRVSKVSQPSRRVSEIASSGVVGGSRRASREQSTLSKAGEQSNESADVVNSRPSSSKLQSVEEAAPSTAEPLISFNNQPASAAQPDRPASGSVKLSPREPVLIDLGDTTDANGLAPPE